MRCLLCGHDGITAGTEICPHCGVYLKTLMQDVLPEGSLLHGGQYRIDGALGRGGFGITYQGCHVALDEVVAIKEFYPREQAVRERATWRLSVPTMKQEVYQRNLKRFLREGRILAKLRNPCVVRVRDLFEERDTAYLVMELVNGKTLRELLDENPKKGLPLDQVKQIMDQLVYALQDVHGADVYHLDLKPENVLLTPGGQVVLIDFGAARQGFSGHTTTTQPHDPEYAAPEVIAANEVGPESDIFELGMMLCEMLTGERPPSALSRLMDDTWSPVHLSRPWQDLVEASLKLRRDERPKNMKTWWKDIGGFDILFPIMKVVDNSDKSQEKDIVTAINKAIQQESKKEHHRDEKMNGTRSKVKDPGSLVISQLDKLFE